MNLNVEVKNLNVECSYPMRSPAIAMSDCCRTHATSVVKTDNGLMYRCEEHIGLIRGLQRGRIYYVISRAREK